MRKVASNIVRRFQANMLYKIAADNPALTSGLPRYEAAKPGIAQAVPGANGQMGKKIINFVKDPNSGQRVGDTVGNAVGSAVSRGITGLWNGARNTATGIINTGRDIGNGINAAGKWLGNKIYEYHPDYAESREAERRNAQPLTYGEVMDAYNARQRSRPFVDVRAQQQRQGR